MRINFGVSIVIMLVLIILLATGFGPAKFDRNQNKLEWKTLIRSEIEEDRVSAQHLVLNNRKDMIKYLVSVLDSPLRPHEEFYTSTTSRNIAIFLLGELRAKEAVTDLVKWLTPKPGQGLTIDFEPMYSPAGYALVKIGLPSVPPLLELVKSAPTPALREELLKIIVSILGEENTKILIVGALTKEISATKRDNLKAAMDLLTDPKFENILRTCASKSQLE